MSNLEEWIKLALVMGWCLGHEDGYREGCRDAWASSLTRLREETGFPPTPERRTRWGPIQGLMIRIPKR